MVNQKKSQTQSESRWWKICMTQALVNGTLSRSHLIPSLTPVKTVSFCLVR